MKNVQFVYYHLQKKNEKEVEIKNKKKEIIYNTSKEIKIDNNTINTNNADFSNDRFNQEDKNNKITVENNYIKKNGNVLKNKKRKRNYF